MTKRTYPEEVQNADAELIKEQLALFSAKRCKQIDKFKAHLDLEFNKFKVSMLSNFTIDQLGSTFLSLRPTPDSPLDLTSNTNKNQPTPIQSMPFGYNKYLLLYIRCFISGCNQLFTSRADLKTHMLIVHNEHNYKCPLLDCSVAAFEKFADLQKHIKRDHAGVSEWKCTKCYADIFSTDVFFSTSVELISHYQHIHEQRGFFKCTVEDCQATFANSFDAYWHFDQEHIHSSTKTIIEGVRIRSEGIKTLTFKSAELFLNPQTVPECVNANVTFMYRTESVNCTEDNCELEFLNVSLLEKHIVEDHGLKLFPCPSYCCGKSFETRDALANHLKIHRYISMDCFLSDCSNKTILRSGLKRIDHNFQCHYKGDFVCNFTSGMQGCNFKSNYRYPVIEHYVLNHAA